MLDTDKKDGGWLKLDGTFVACRQCYHLEAIDKAGFCDNQTVERLGWWQVRHSLMNPGSWVWLGLYVATPQQRSFIQRWQKEENNRLLTADELMGCLEKKWEPLTDGEYRMMVDWVANPALLDSYRVTA